MDYLHVQADNPWYNYYLASNKNIYDIESLLIESYLIYSPGEEQQRAGQTALMHRLGCALVVHLQLTKVFLGRGLSNTVNSDIFTRVSLYENETLAKSFCRLLM